MKKWTQKTTLFFSALALSFGCLAAVALADDSKTVTIRIEGNDANVYYGSVTSQTDTIAELMAELDANQDDLTIENASGSYITAINGDVAGSYGIAYDGWQYTINGIAGDSVDSQTFEDGDEILFYYSDEYNTGFQKPEVDLGKLDEGILTFTSQDTVYDENWNATLVENPVVGADVTWYVGEKAYSYVTDEQGQISLDTDVLTAGSHKLQIEKYTDDGMVMVLRFAPDYTVLLENSEESNSDDGVENGMAGWLLLAGLSLTTAGILSRKWIAER